MNQRPKKKKPEHQQILVRRSVSVPDRIKTARYEKAPELGPRILFFSGGTALKRVSKTLIRYTHHSSHLITPFDSGGSSAVIRKAFQMLSIGDLRNRLMALADQSVKGNPDIYALFAYRLPTDQKPDRLLKKLQSMAEGWDSLIDGIPTPMRDIICNHLKSFLQFMPDDFDLRGANIGNLVLTAGYLTNHRQIDTVLYLFSRLVEARGYVRPTVTEHLHLGIQLRNGAIAVGQDRITAGFAQQEGSPVMSLFLSASPDQPERVGVEISAETTKDILRAEVICYPMGSFFTSVLPNLLPRGVGSAVAANQCPKVYIPNTLTDVEQFGLSLSDAVKALCDCLGADGNGGSPTDYVNLILIDTANVKYPYDLDLAGIREFGIDILDTPLVTPESFPYIDPDYICNILLSLT